MRRLISSFLPFTEKFETQYSNMSKKSTDLKGLFNTKKTNTKKKTAKAEAEVEEEVQDAPETKNEEVQKTVDQPKEEAKVAPQEKPAKKPVNFMADSDEDEDRDLGDEFKGKIRTMQDVDKERRVKEQKDIDTVQGFGLERASAATDAEVSLSSSAAAKTTNDSGMKFSKGKPMFFNKNKQAGLLAKSEFPELGSVSEMQDKGPSAKKAEDEDEKTGDKFDFLSSAARPSGGEQQRQPQSFGTGVKPVFTSSKKKGNLGGADLADIANSRQNYDMSFLGSKAKDPDAKPEEKLDAEGNPIPQQREERQKRENRREYKDLDDN